MARAQVPFSRGVRVSLIGHLGAFMCVNTLWFRHDSAVNIFVLNGFNNDLFNAFAPAYISILSRDYTLDGFRALSWEGSFSVSAFRTADPDTIGLIDEDSLPGNDAMIVQMRGSSRDVHFVNRNYVPAIPVTMVSSGNLVDPAHLAAAKAAYELIPSLIPTSWEWQVASSFNAGSARTTVAHHIVEEVRTPNPYVVQMRRRVGSNHVAV